MDNQNWIAQQLSYVHRNAAAAVRITQGITGAIGAARHTQGIRAGVNHLPGLCDTTVLLPLHPPISITVRTPRQQKEQNQ